MDGPNVPSDARSEGWVWEGRRRPSQHGGLGAMPPENFSKINIEIAYFSAFLRPEMVSSVVASRQD